VAHIAMFLARCVHRHGHVLRPKGRREIQSTTDVRDLAWEGLAVTRLSDNQCIAITNAHVGQRCLSGRFLISPPGRSFRRGSATTLR
jgi:hypothetical protein